MNYKLLFLLLILFTTGSLIPQEVTKNINQEIPELNEHKFLSASQLKSVESNTSSNKLMQVIKFYF